MAVTASQEVAPPERPQQTLAGLPTRPGVLALGRVAAVAALGSAAVHVLLLDATSLGSLLMVAMAAVCLPCAWHLWRSPTASVWRFTALVDAAMLVVHLQMLSEPSMDMPGMTQDPDPLMWLGLGLVGTQLVLAGGAALTRRT